jgi:hypothetical protein
MLYDDRFVLNRGGLLYVHTVHIAVAVYTTPNTHTHLTRVSPSNESK